MANFRFVYTCFNLAPSPFSKREWGEVNHRTGLPTNLKLTVEQFSSPCARFIRLAHPFLFGEGAGSKWGP